MGSCKQFLGRFFVALAATVFFASGATAAKPAVPFKALIAITEQLGPPSAGCASNALVLGTGAASHIGAMTSRSIDCVNLDPATGVFSFSSTNIVLTAANGDQVFGIYEGTVDPTTAIGVITGRFTITGGTGRFLNASGGGLIQGLEVLDIPSGSGQGQIQLNGTMSY
jgi:hypothetical protein